MTALVIAMFWAMTVQAQESQDSIESVNKLVALQEVVIKGGLPNTRLKAGAMVTRIEGTPLAQSGTLGEMHQFRQCNRFSTHKLLLSIVYRLNATRSKYKGTGAGEKQKARM